MNSTGNIGTRKSRKYDLATAESDYAERRGAPDKTLVICTQQRSGSTLLGEAIYFAGRLGCPLEYFHSGFRPDFERRWGVYGIQTYADAVHHYRTDPSGVFSNKLFWWDVIDLVKELAPTEFDKLSRGTAAINDPSLYRRIHATIKVLFPNPVFVYLSRQDTVAQAISHNNAVESRKWRQFTRTERVRPVPYDFDTIVHYLARIQNENRHWQNFFHANALPYYSVVYEELANNYEATLRQLFTWLGRPDANVVPPRLQKQADAQSEELRRRFLADFRERTGGGA